MPARRTGGCTPTPATVYATAIKAGNLRTTADHQHAQLSELIENMWFDIVSHDCPFTLDFDCQVLDN
jgi:hypothetical protein